MKLVRSKIVIDNKIIEQVNSFNYLGHLVPCEKEVDIDNKLNNYMNITGIIYHTFGPQKTWKETRIKLHNTLSLTALLHSSENWVITVRDARRITAAEMKYMRKTAGYTWTDYKTNTEIAKELNITPVLDKIQEYRRNKLQHINRLPCNRLLRIIKKYIPTGRRNQRRPLKRLLDEDWNGWTPCELDDD